MKSPHTVPKGNILIVDDTPDNLRLLSSTLTERGYKVRVTAMQSVRQSVRALRADQQAEQPLEEVVAALAEEFRQVTGITPTTRIQLAEAIPAKPGAGCQIEVEIPLLEVLQ